MNLDTYKVAVGRAWVEIDFKAQAVYVRLIDTPVERTIEIGTRSAA